MDCIDSFLHIHFFYIILHYLFIYICIVRALVPATAQLLSHHAVTSTCTLWQYIFMYTFCVSILFLEVCDYDHDDHEHACRYVLASPDYFFQTLQPSCIAYLVQSCIVCTVLCNFVYMPIAT